MGSIGKEWPAVRIAKPEPAPTWAQPEKAPVIEPVREPVTVGGV